MLHPSYQVRYLESQVCILVCGCPGNLKVLGIKICILSLISEPLLLHFSNIILFIHVFIHFTNTCFIRYFRLKRLFQHLVKMDQLSLILYYMKRIVSASAQDIV